MSNSGDLQELYKDLSENMRQYTNMRFAQLTIFVALTGSLVVVGFGGSLAKPNSIVLAVVGILIAVVFWVMEERAADFWHHFKDRAVELESQLNYRQYTDLPTAKGKGWISATNATRLFHYGAILFWIAFALGWCT